MKYLLLFFTIIFISPLAIAQEEMLDTKVVDSLYREDQFYLGVTYNLLSNKPEGISQNGFSSGFHFGIIRDMPINKNRNNAIGVGLGLSINSFIQDLLISEDSNKASVFSELDAIETVFSKNKFFTYLIELPVEFRWRTSTSTDYDFWRIYTGFKVGYQFANATKFVGQPEVIQLNNIDEFNTLQYGLTLSLGYSTWNFHVYYGLNKLFDNANLDGQSINIKTLKAGLMFYIL